MDPLAHTAVGACLAKAGLERASPLATATLIIGANLPDVDAIAGAWGREASMLFRRGWTHGVLAMVVLPLLLAAGVLLWDRGLRRRRAPASEPARAGVIVGLSFLGVLSHPFFDWLNTYGIRLLMPFDGRWFYGDALFIVDPILWLTMGGALVLAHSRTPASAAGWILLLSLMTSVVTLSDRPPMTTKVLWCAALLGLFVVRVLRLFEGRIQRVAQVGFLLGAAYVGSMIASSELAASRARALAARGGHVVHAHMAAPAAGNPFHRTVVLELDDEYQVFELDWLRGGQPEPQPSMPRVESSTQTVRLAEVIEAARRAELARATVARARFPLYTVQRLPEGWRVGLGDARRAVRGGERESQVVWLDDRLEPARAP